MRYCVITKIAIYSNKHSASISSIETVSVCWPLHQTPCIISTILCPGWHGLPPQVWIWYSPSQPATLHHECVSTVYQYSNSSRYQCQSLVSSRQAHPWRVWCFLWSHEHCCDSQQLQHLMASPSGKYLVAAWAPKWHLVWLAFHWSSWRGYVVRDHQETSHVDPLHLNRQPRKFLSLMLWSRSNMGDSTLICTLNPLMSTSSFTGHPVTPNTLRQAFHTVYLFTSIVSVSLKSLSRR